MKVTNKVAVAVIASVVVGELYGLIIPKGSDDSLAKKPLETSSIAYMDNQYNDSTVNLVVGSDEGNKMVVDPGALRGVRRIHVPDSCLCVMSDGNWTSVDGKWKWSTAYFGENPHRSSFTVSSTFGVEFGSDTTLELRAETISPNMIKPDVTVSYVVSPRYITVNFEFPATEGFDEIPCSVVVDNIRVVCSAPGSRNESVNLKDDISITVVDSIGSIDLYDLRHNAIHANDGNLGEDWAKYPAVSSVKLDKGSQYTFSEGSVITHPEFTNDWSWAGAAVTGKSDRVGMVMKARGADVMTVYAEGPRNVGELHTMLHIASIKGEYGSDGLEIAIRVDENVPAFYDTALDLYAATSLTYHVDWTTNKQSIVGGYVTNPEDYPWQTNGWTKLERNVDWRLEGDVKTGKLVVRVLNGRVAGNPLQFFKLGYPAEFISGYRRVDFHDNVVFNGDLVTRCPDDGRLYALTVRVVDGEAKVVPVPWSAAPLP